MNNLEASYIGCVEYKKAYAIQENLYQIVKEKSMHAIIGLEHPAVLTLGHRLNHGSEITANIPWVQSSRGGLATIHSEGQLVIYPVLDLRALKWGVKDYVCHLLKTTQELLSDLQIKSEIDEKAVGLYTEEGKIAFCGIQIRNGISLHGISLNVRNDLSLFQNISPCGVQGARLDRLQNYNVNLALDELFHRWVKIFRLKMSQVQ